MQTIGERLEEARKRKGISIREAAEHTKIRGDYLQKFEANSFDIDLPPLYIRGFLRTYSRYLDLDPERVVGEVDAALGREGKPQRREHREALGRVDFGAEPRKTDSSETGEKVGGSPVNDKAMLIKFGLLGGGALLAIAIIILLINVLISRPPAKPAQSAQNQTAEQTAQPAANPPSVQIVTFTATAKTRIKIATKAEGKVLADNITLNEGKSFTVNKTEPLLVTVEDRTKLRMEINGRLYDIPKLQHDPYGQFTLD
jgi:cytoskeleton protein RodZ